MWKVNQGLNGTLDAYSPNEAMSHNGCTITNIKIKANTFVLDFSKAYDIVWREKLLFNMLDTGIPPMIIWWLYSFLNNCKAHTKVYLKDFVLEPSLFLFVINNLASPFTNDAVADDVWITTTVCKREDAKAAAQSVINSVFNWSQHWKLKHNASKSEVCPF